LEMHWCLVAAQTAGCRMAAASDLEDHR
jgi:hypothetical protein